VLKDVRTFVVGSAVQQGFVDIHTDAQTPEPYCVPSRLQTSLWLVATVLVVAPVRVAGPGVGLDPAWVTGLNLARHTQMRYGRDLIFTYGPWGFLDVPLALTRRDLVLGLAFSVASVVAFWFLSMFVLRSKLQPRVTLLAASILTVAVSCVSSPSSLLVVAAMVVSVRHLRQSPKLSTTWCPVAVAGLASLLVQIKISEGLAVTAFAVITSFASPRARLTRTTYSALTWLVTSWILWVAAGQSNSDVRPWLEASADIVKGYTSAMSLESYPDTLSFVWYLTAMLLVASILFLEHRQSVGPKGLPHVGVVVVTCVALFFGFRQSFTRHDQAHNAIFFVIAALLLSALLARGPKWRLTVVLITLSSVMASLPFSTYVRSNPADSWALSWKVITSDESRLALLDQARGRDRAAYGLSASIVEATHGHLVAVDPWEVSIVWAYSMKWSPMPVFQNYSAYTARLDQLNAAAAQGAGDDQMIIRATAVSTDLRRTLIDGRNPMWESPRYTLAAVCNYAVVTSDRRWMLLRKDIHRCGASTPTTDPRQVSAGEEVQVPSAGSNQIVTTSFVPSSPNRLVSLATLIFKAPEPLVVSVDGEAFRLPEGLASGPLLTVLPTTLDWPADFRGHTSARSISFSRPGKVQFHTILMTR
jgi:hypothetical protein